MAAGLSEKSDLMFSNYTGHVFAAAGHRPAKVSKAAAQRSGVQRNCLAGGGRSKAEDSSPVVNLARVAKRSGGDFVPAKMVKNVVAPVVSAALCAHSHFRELALVVSFPRYLGKQVRPGRIKIVLTSPEINHTGDSF